MGWARRATPDWEEAATAGAAAGAEVLGLLSRRLVPVETGELRGSQRHGSTGPGAAAVTYLAPYAPYVHDNPDAYHDDGQAHFLAEPARTGAPQIRTAIARAMATQLTGGR